MPDLFKSQASLFLTHKGGKMKKCEVTKEIRHFLEMH
jgi:hypothetical protein